ncbi:large ribosomal subunit protein uL16m [Culicoides brevitarsis]|uniref:large ribosomal subunit protein uL16m n=1 Tax=Culicoides brevitarsis TaxID=469753 RepID=UPI00307C35CD
MSLYKFRPLLNQLLAVRATISTQTCGLKNFPAPVDYSNVEFAEKPKLPFLPKVPQYPPNLRPPKMQKRLRYMRGPEPIHNTFLHKQYGIVATGGGRLRWGHLEMVRLTLGRKIDTNRMFAMWRIDPPWQPLTKKGQGSRMGKGKGSIDHYVTPIKRGRVIIELAGKCEFAEVQGWLQQIADKLPFKAMAMSQEMMDQVKLEEERIEKENLNPWPLKYVIQNNLGGCHRWLKPIDHKHFGKYT